MRLVRASDGQVVAERLRVADTAWSRFRGLMGRARLEPGEALWLEPCSSIHMMFMRFAIDVVFLQRGRREPLVAGAAGEVLKVCSGVPSWVGMAWCPGATAAVELEAGQAERRGVAAGDRLVLEASERVVGRGEQR